MNATKHHEVILVPLTHWGNVQAQYTGLIRTINSHTGTPCSCTVILLDLSLRSGFLAAQKGFRADAQQPCRPFAASQQQVSGSLLPVRQVLSAKRAANTPAWPSSGARILARAPTTDGVHGGRPEEEEKEEEEKEEVVEGSRC